MKRAASRCAVPVTQHPVALWAGGGPAIGSQGPQGSLEPVQSSPLQTSDQDHSQTCCAQSSPRPAPSRPPASSSYQPHPPVSLQGLSMALGAQRALTSGGGRHPATPTAFLTPMALSQAPGQPPQHAVGPQTHSRYVQWAGPPPTQQAEGIFTQGAALDPPRPHSPSCTPGCGHSVAVSLGWSLCPLHASVSSPEKWAWPHLCGGTDEPRPRGLCKEGWDWAVQQALGEPLGDCIPKAQQRGKGCGGA